MLNLAPIRYAEVMAPKGGPIRTLDFAQRDVYGRDCTEAVAYLDDRFRRGAGDEGSLLDMPDGAGTHPRLQTACHMALSEAIERWAVFHCRKHQGDPDGAIELDGSSNGFAAFPGLFRRQARNAAYRESVERHCLMCWWEGLLGHASIADPFPGLSAIQLDNPFSSHVVTVVWTDSRTNRAYAFGSGTGRKHSIWRSLVELSRTRRIVDSLSTSSPDSNSLGDLYLRRIRYFSAGVGLARFEDRLNYSVGGKPPMHRLLFDSAVAGPWDRYASVWRTVIEPPSPGYLQDDDSYFFW